MKRNMIKRIAAVAMAGAMMVSMSVPAMAEGGATEGSKITFNKELDVEAHVYVPDVTYTFSVSSATETECISVGTQKVVSGDLASLEGLDANGEFTIKTEADVMKDPTKTAGSLKVGSKVLTMTTKGVTEPGIYRYKVVEKDFGNYEGISKTNPDQSWFLDAYITYDGTDNKALKVKYFVLKDKLGEKSSGTFNNKYTTNEVTVTKKIAGDQGFSKEGFEFTITATPSTTTSNEKYCVTDSQGNELPVSKDGDNKWTIKLNDDQSATIHGLTASDIFSIVESDKNLEGWTTTVTAINNTTKIDNKERSASGNGATNENITVTNTKNATPPMGIVMDIAPYIIMVAAAGVLAFVFLRRRNYTK